VTEYEDLIDELHADIPVREGDKIKAGRMEFTVMDLPGHTKCSVGYYLASEKLLLSTETLGVYDGGEIVFPSYLVGYRMALDSISRVQSLKADHLLLPHYGLLAQEKTSFYLHRCYENAVSAAEDISKILQCGGSHEDAVRYFCSRFYCGNVPAIYPEDAMAMNTDIMVNLLERELCGKNT